MVSVVCKRQLVQYPNCISICLEIISSNVFHVYIDTGVRISDQSLSLCIKR
jgi:hypothetical protein